MKNFILSAMIAVAMTSCCNNKCDKNEFNACANATETTASTKPDVP